MSRTGRGPFGWPLTVIALYLLSGGEPARALMCPVGITIREAVAKADAVFLGELTAILEPGDNPTSSHYADITPLYEFRVIRSWKGPRRESISIYMDWPAETYEPGQTYMVFARGHRSGDWFSSLCSAPNDIPRRLAAEIRYLDSLWWFDPALLRYDLVFIAVTILAGIVLTGLDVRKLFTKTKEN